MAKPIADPADVSDWLPGLARLVKRELIKQNEELTKKLAKLKKIKTVPLNKKSPYTLAKIAQDRILPEDLTNE